MKVALNQQLRSTDFNRLQKASTRFGIIRAGFLTQNRGEQCRASEIN
jgi:hypothetical protein